jgi:hypothetical protein
MKNDRLFWGVILVVFGTLFLVENLGYVELTFNRIWRFWPILLIYWGFSALLKKRDGSTGLLLLVIQILLLGFTLFFVVHPSNNRKNGNPSTENREENAFSGADERKYEFSEPYSKNIKTANLELEFGAGTLLIQKGSTNLIDANAITNLGGYSFTKEVSGESADLSLKYEGENLRFERNTSYEHELEVSLNTNPNWLLNLDIGATDAEIDLSELKVQQVSMDCGAAKINLKLGNPSLGNSVIDLDAGMADVKIKLPGSVQAEILSKTALSSRTFEGFEKVSNGHYRTPEFKSSTSTWIIKLNGGMSNLEVTR